VPELGAQSESDINGQISIWENAVFGQSGGHCFILRRPNSPPLGKPIDEAAKQVKIIGIDSAADSKAFVSFLTTDNVQGGRVCRRLGLAKPSKAKYGQAEGDVALITSIPGVRFHWTSGLRGLKRKSQPNIRA